MVLAIRRKWVNDWTWPSRTYLITTMTAPQLIRTTPWFEDDAGLTTDDEDSAKVLSTRMVIKSRVCEPRSVRHTMAGVTCSGTHHACSGVPLVREGTVADDSTKSSHILVGAQAPSLNSGRTRGIPFDVSIALGSGCRPQRTRKFLAKVSLYLSFN